MFQSVGVEIVPHIAKAMDVPLIRHEILGKSVNTDMLYNEAKSGDEVEDLY